MSRMTKRNTIRYSIQGVVLIGLISYLFFDSWIAFLLLLPGLKLYLSQKREECARRRIYELVDDFKNFLAIYASNLQAGYSIENALEESFKDMAVMTSQDADMMRELNQIINGIHNNLEFGDLLTQFADRSGVEEIVEFSGVFRTAKSSGGNLTTMIRQCSELIHDKVEVKSEIRTITAEKQLECKLMTGIPFGIMGYINVTTPGYFGILYHNMTGIVIMAVCLAVYLLAVYLSGRLIHIEV